jgi:hypothetical protein
MGSRRSGEGDCFGGLAVHTTPRTVRSNGACSDQSYALPSVSLDDPATVAVTVAAPSPLPVPLPALPLLPLLL